MVTITMAVCAVLHVSFLLMGISSGQTSVIQTEPTVLAALGGEAHLKCRLTQSKVVQQVSWLKIPPNMYLASFHKIYGQSVNPDYRDRMKFRFTALQSCSIVIREVMEQDEGCYHCLFNSPEGSFTGRTCLQLYELHPPVLHVRASNSTAESAVSCSATGRPAPTVTLTVTQPDLHLSPYSTVSVNNTNGTVTVTTTAVLSGLHRNGAQVGCAARVLSAPQIEVLESVPEASAGGLDEGSEDRGLSGRIRMLIIIPPLFVMVICAVLYAARLIKKE
ncbi:OX-2 membrane glycoprotein-like isoform X11 [Parambassis ranga]|uniref:OX-2 membrane glycoprotein-like isoform X11 n=1 Tax=Parambassis ranga TaxID=210632 RepID=A0A6P7I6Z1_9TELE|nr:OX-2 membrane glycoprotein-like isoform X11 [Parambassis ranga]XP_028256135.1 OX-2 membrane glycoprotein-like isoform X11 [Parambassis ranga]